MTTELHNTKQVIFCSNCGQSGHVFRQCIEPVSSYGALVFRWISRTPEWPQQAAFCTDSRHPTGISNLVPQVLMIQRKNTLGFMDIMRGKYKLSEPEYICKQIRGMTTLERNMLLNDDFDKIWNDLWGVDLESSQRYANNRQSSKQKLAELRDGVTNHKGDSYNLKELLRREPVLYETPEWGFPKGRRDLFESDIQCAYRELHEETGIMETDLLKVVNLQPFVEQFYGSNNIHYRHTYYIAQYIGTNNIDFDKNNMEMTREIRNIAWKNLDDALVILRPENLEKKGILIQLANLLRKYSPVLPYNLHGQKLVNENTEKEQQEAYVFIPGVRSEQPRRFLATKYANKRPAAVGNRGAATGHTGRDQSRRSAQSDECIRNEYIRK
jgi:8-oxo-dGTP pyrophosphatase MutT (NUDIX family)